ncbi:uncharacterized protein LOC141912212 [Tubulanus polymorphus]|uniref:uncharacterized protein LOC141912212 n=1 Tax=Tubulanus polymorphus TaxID=672921 RepID=UPI003DA5AA39
MTSSVCCHAPSPRTCAVYSPCSNDINNYLRMYDTDVMLWRCRNAITRNWDRKPIPYVDLYCEVLGKVKSIDVFHNWQKMKYKKQYTILVAPHFANGRYYSRWLDFRVRLHNVTRKNTGSYIVRIKSPYGNMEMQMIFLDVAHTKQPRRNKHENETKPRKNRKRRRRRRRRKKEE